MEQFYNHPVYMDYDKDYMEKHDIGLYAPI